MANKLRVSKSGSGAPTSITPDFLGQIYIDEDTGTRYEASALTEGSWVDKLSLKEDVANKVTSFQGTPDDNHYPSEKLVKDSLDTKQDTMTKASGSEIRELTDDAKYITPLGLKDSYLLKWRIGGSHSGDVAPEMVENTIISEYNILATGSIAIKPPTIGVYGTDYETGMKLLLSIESVWDIAWDTIYESNGLVLPRKGNGSVMYLTFIYQNNKWRLISADPYVLASGLKRQETVETSDDIGNDLIPLGCYKENELYVTALSRSASIKPPYCLTGHSVSNGNTLLIRIKDNGTAQTLSWNPIYKAIGVELPTTTTAGKTLYIGCKYNSADSKWDVLAVGQEEA